MLPQEARVRQGLLVALSDDLRGLPEPHPLERGGDLERLGLGGLTGLHGVDGLEHGGDAGPLVFDNV